VLAKPLESRLADVIVRNPHRRAAVITALRAPPPMVPATATTWPSLINVSRHVPDDYHPLAATTQGQVLAALAAFNLFLKRKQRREKVLKQLQ
jgi:hypothetical protein